MPVNPPTGSDPQRGSLSDDPVEQVISPAKRAVSFYLQKQQSDLNIQPPHAQFDQFGKRFFEGAPVPLKRVFQSPLSLTGSSNNIGPNGERRVTSGWGDARAQDYDADAIVGTRRHGGLDFAGPVGETIFACADGIVTFVGFQNRPRGATQIVHPHVDAHGNVLDNQERIVAHPGNLGHGGIFIQIKHNADFEGYWTEYMHCSDTNVRLGQKVLQGDPIANVGLTGGNSGIVTSGSHLHWQVRFRGIIVRPDFLVPHLWVGHELVKTDGTINQNTGTALASIAQSKSMTVAEATMLNHTANQLTGLERQARLENLSSADLKELQGNHAALVAKNLGVHVSAMYEAIAKFQSGRPEVQNPMTFDFDKGTWTDGEPV